MVVDVINEYLKSNRRLVIPSFGAFVTKEDGQIIFSELLKKDDGILRGLLVAKGLREIEAAGKIDRFVFEIRHALMQVGACPVADFGTFYRTAEGVVTFDATKPILEPIPAVAEPAADVVPAAVTPTPTPAPAPAPVEAPAAPAQTEAPAQAHAAPAEEPAPAPAPVFDAFIASLSDEERMQFTDLYILKTVSMPEIPTYEVGGNNKSFFNKVFIYIGQYRDKIPSGLLAKMYDFSVKA
jgi:nucleoid DNA-binding protein